MSNFLKVNPYLPTKSRAAAAKPSFKTITSIYLNYVKKFYTQNGIQNLAGSNGNFKLSKLTFSTTDTNITLNTQGTLTVTQPVSTLTELTQITDPTAALPVGAKWIWNRTKKSINIPASGALPAYKLPPNEAGIVNN